MHQRPLREVCGIDAHCAGTSCYTNAGTGRRECRLGNNGEPCDAASDCVANICSVSTCGCNFDGECPSSLRCYNRQCRLGNNGEACDHYTDCASGTCFGVIPFGTCQNFGSSCCNIDGECPGQRCYNYQCRFGGPNEPCGADYACRADYACHAYTCQKGQWSWHCKTTQDCQSGLSCNGGTCN